MESQLCLYCIEQINLPLLIDNVKLNVGKIDLVASLENYYGISLTKKCVVNLIPWQTRGNYGTNNSEEICCNICVNTHSTDDSNAYSGGKTAAGYLSLIHHEFSHSIINPLTDKYDQIINKKKIFSDIFKKMSKQAYGTNATILNEYVIRASTLRWGLINRIDNWEQYEKSIVYEEEMGFINIKDVLDSLIYYENNRDQFPNIEKYYPQIINAVLNKYK